MPSRPSSPALVAAQAAQRQVNSCVDENSSFLLEAGAGAGKTYSLTETLQYLIDTRGRSLQKSGQRIACITYTNAATDEIVERIDRHPLVLASTIHSFFWTLIRNFQAVLKPALLALPRWSERLAENGIASLDDLRNRTINYTLGYPVVSDTEVLLHHSDVLSLSIALLEYPKFRALLASRFPFILIDEYQDTDKDLTQALTKHFLDCVGGVTLGFFGDHWQKIYGTGCGRISHHNLKEIGKGANFRSVSTIVSCLNRIRPELQQDAEDPTSVGSVVVFHTNNWIGTRQSASHWKGDLPRTTARNALSNVVAWLQSAQGWKFIPSATKILMLTHTLLASEQGYEALADVFEYSEDYIQKEHPHIAFFADTLEPALNAFEHGKYGDMFDYLGSRVPLLQSPADKTKWTEAMSSLLEKRLNGSVAEVLQALEATKRVSLPDRAVRLEKALTSYVPVEGEPQPRRLLELKKFHDVPYREVSALAKFLAAHTPFATKHSVKGLEFENVLVVIGRGWNLYDFGRYLEWSNSGGPPPDKQAAFERARNLFYVACSRPVRRLAILFTQELSAQALGTLSSWFGNANIRQLDPAAYT